MAIASVHRRAAGPAAHRIERRNRKRSRRENAAILARMAGWVAAFLVLAWLAAAGFYGLLVNV